MEHGGGEQACCLCAGSGHGCGGTSGVVASASGGAVIKRSDSKLNGPLGEIATGVMLATGFAHWGWGHGLGWYKPDKVILGNGIGVRRPFSPASSPAPFFSFHRRRLRDGLRRRVRVRSRRARRPPLEPVRLVGLARLRAGLQRLPRPRLRHGLWRRFRLLTTLARLAGNVYLPSPRRPGRRRRRLRNSFAK